MAKDNNLKPSFMKNRWREGQPKSKNFIPLYDRGDGGSRMPLKRKVTAEEPINHELVDACSEILKRGDPLPQEMIEQLGPKERKALRPEKLGITYWVRVPNIT